MTADGNTIGFRPVRGPADPRRESGLTKLTEGKGVTQAALERALSFDEVVDRHQREVYLYLYRMSRNAADAEDLFQETLLRAYRSFARLQVGSNHRAWLYKIATNAFLNFNRRRRRETTIEAEHLAAVADEGAGAEEQLRQKRLATEVVRFIAALPPKQRAALVQRKYEGLSYAEIAVNLSCSEAAARASVFQAVRKVKSHFDDSRKRGVGV